MLLNSKIIGSGDKTVIVLHGLYGSSDSWLPVVKYFPADYQFHLLDLRNHGNSFHSDEFNYEVMINDLLEYLEFHKISSAYFIGHSMGGKLAMFFADKFPYKIRKAVIADISPRSNNSLLETDPKSLFHLNLISKMSSINIENFKTYKEIEEFFADLDKKTISVILKNIKKFDNKFHWKINIESIKNNLPEILKGLDIDNFIENKIEVPVLFLKGEHSDYISSTDLKMIKFIFSNSDIKIVENAGHWLHVEKPREVSLYIREFFEKP
ncbi:MAG: alpha/beta hydrolase [Bacteroidales bacterium]|jgi:pimeloyl-ACP methyl ester carboxylesterase